MIRGLAKDPGIGVLLLDIVLGFGAHPDPAGEAAREVLALRAARGAESPIVVIATLTGTADDPQGRDGQAAKLKEAGIVIAESVRAAALLAVRALAAQRRSHEEPPALLRANPVVVNIGLRGFAEDLNANGIRVVHLQWEPAAGGNERLRRLVEQLQ